MYTRLTRFLMVILYGFLPNVLSHQNSEMMLQFDLINSQSKFNIPNKNRSRPLTVTFGLELISLLSVVEQEQLFGINCWIRLSWMNDFGRWIPVEYGNRTKTKLDSKSIWTPDIVLKEDISESFQTLSEISGTAIVMSYNGTNTWYIPANFESSCQYDTTDFPFDHQICVLTFSSWLHDSEELHLIPDEHPITSENYVESDAWVLVAIHRKVQSTKYECCANPYTEIQYTIELGRKTKYYLETLLYPCIVQIAIILSTFFLSPESGERIEIVLTVLLVYAVYLGIISNYLPKSSGSAPILTNFYFAILTESASTLIASCIVVGLHFRGMEKGVPPMAKWVRKLLIDGLAKYLGIGRNLRSYKNEDLLALRHSIRKKSKEKERNNLLTSSNSESDFDLSDEDRKVVSKEATGSTVIKDVGVITKLIHDFNRQDEIEEEWQILGKVFDRLFFVIFLIIFIFTCIVIWLPVYLRYHK